jgi:hypothetical protein
MTPTPTSRTRPLAASALALLVLGVLLYVGAAPSGATFIASSTNPGNVFAAAADFNTVAASLADPGGPVRGTVTLTANASSDRSIDHVTFQRADAGGWTDVCTDASAPYTCDLDTTAVADGPLDVRAVATDRAGYSRTDARTVAVDNTAPTLSFVDPGATVRGPLDLQAIAADAGSGVASVRYQYRPSGGGAWQDACTTPDTPYDCTWTTTSVADGTYEVQAIATDGAGNAKTDSRSGVVVDNTAPSVAAPAPGAPLHGTVTLTGSASDASGSGLAHTAIQYRPTGGSTWTDACPASSCSWDTSGLTDGGYDLRITATDGAGNTSVSAPVTNVAIDNHAPTIGLPDPGPAGGSVMLGATTGDGTGTGVTSVVYQYRPSGGGAWAGACTASSTPFNCLWNTSSVTGGTYDVQATATDGAGLSTSTILTGVTVDHTPPSAPAPISPSGPVRGTVAFDPGVHDPDTASVDYYGRQAGTTAWYYFATVGPPFTLVGPTGYVPDGAYELQAVAKDAVGNASPAVQFPGTITIDNTAPTAADVQGTNGGVAGELDAGDAIAFTYSEPIAPASLDPGWDGSDKAVTVTFTDSGAADTLAVYDGGTRVALTAGLQLNADWVSADGSLTGTMSRSGNTVTVTLGGAPAGARTGVSPAANMIWTPSTAATDLAGNAATATARTEQGATDVDF